MAGCERRETYLMSKDMKILKPVFDCAAALYLKMHVSIVEHIDYNFRDVQNGTRQRHVEETIRVYSRASTGL